MDVMRDLAQIIDVNAAATHAHTLKVTTTASAQSHKLRHSHHNRHCEHKSALDVLACRVCPRQLDMAKLFDDDHCDCGCIHYALVAVL